MIGLLHDDGDGHVDISMISMVFPYLCGTGAQIFIHRMTLLATIMGVMMFHIFGIQRYIFVGCHDSFGFGSFSIH